jgi:hypothetical protein
VRHGHHMCAASGTREPPFRTASMVSWLFLATGQN